MVDHTVTNRAVDRVLVTAVTKMAEGGELDVQAMAQAWLDLNRYCSDVAASVQWLGNSANFKRPQP